MTRRLFMSLAAAGAYGPALKGEALRYREYANCLPDYLRSLAAESYEKRNRALASLTTPEALRDRQQWTAETFWKLIGGMPERTPLNARVTGSFERSGYRVENVVYESQPNFLVSGNLYIPSRGNGPFPGVLFQMGHTSNGKAGDLYQKCCQGLAQLGFLVLGFDPMGQGERTYYPGPVPSRTRLPGGADDEHTVPGKQMLLIGDSSARLQLWDTVRSLDYLASHPLVDATRLGVTGQSGGGTNTMMLAAVDSRLAAAAVACGNTENVACTNFNPPGATDDAEQDFPGSGPLGFDRWDLLYPMAPKPLLIMPSARDFFGTYSPNYISSGWEEFGKLKAVYEMMGHPDRLAWNDTPLPHGLAYEFRMAIYNWFQRWLQQAAPITEEPPLQPEAEKTLFVSPGGSLVRDFHSETPLTLMRRRVIVKKPRPLVDLLSLDLPQDPRATTLGQTSFRRVRIEAIEVPSAPGVWTAAWLYLPEQVDSTKSVLVLLDPAGRGNWQEGGIYDTLASQGHPVCAVDVRGIGDLTPAYGRGSARYNATHRSEQHYAWGSMILGKTLASQRTTDILATVAALRARPELANRTIAVAARGILTIPAQFAAAIDKKIDQLYLAGGLVSFQNVLEMEEFLGANYHNSDASGRQDLFGGFVPGILEHTDLPEVIASIAPRQVKLAGAIDASGKTLDLQTVERIYAGQSHVTVSSEERWDVAALSV